MAVVGGSVVVASEDDDGVYTSFGDAGCYCLADSPGSTGYSDFDHVQI